MSGSTSDVLVIGGGVIGLSVAWSCAGSGLSVRLVEADRVGGGASWASAGILAPGPTEPVRSAFGQMLGLSSRMHGELSEQLRELTGVDDGYWQCGCLELGFDPAQAHSLRSAAGHYRKGGVIWEELAPTQARTLEPGLTDRVQAVYHVPQMAQVRTPRRLQALAMGCVRRGVAMQLGCPVIGFERDGQRVTGVCCAQDRFYAHTTVVAAGAWSRAVLERLGTPLPVRPIRGQIALLACDRPVLRHIIMSGKRYLVPRPDGHVLVGSTEEETGFDTRPTAGAVRDLLQFAESVVPALRQAALVRAWAGLRPKTADGKYFIGPVPEREGILVAAGHFRTGFQVAPATGLIIRQLIQGDSPCVPIDGFRLDRLSGQQAGDGS